MAKVLLSLLAVFAPLSLATIGGSQAILADVQRQVVEIHRSTDGSRPLSS